MPDDQSPEDRAASWILRIARRAAVVAGELVFLAYVSALMMLPDDRGDR